jgi:hypothetical protein
MSFPELAWPMLDRVLEHHFPATRAPEILLMQRIVARFPLVHCASLPK